MLRGRAVVETRFGLLESVDLPSPREFHSIVASGAAGEAVDLEVMLHQWGMLQTPYLAYYGQVAVTDIA